MTWRALRISLYKKVAERYAWDAALARAGGEKVLDDPKVGRCRLTVSKPVLKPPVVSGLEARKAMNRFQILLSFSACGGTRSYCTSR